MGAVSYRFRAELRERWRSWLGLALLVGLAAGGVTALLAGARRTDSAYSRYLDAQRAPDALVINEPNDEDPTAQFDLDEIARLPQVEDSVRVGYGFVAIGSGVTSLTPLDDRFGDEVDRLDVVEGRLPDADRPEEVALSTTVAELDDLQVGDSVDLLEPAIVEGGVPEDLSELPPQDQALVRQVTNLDPINTLRVVGIVTAPGTFPPQPRTPCCAFHSLAFGAAGTPGEALAVRLADGADVSDLRADLEPRAGGLPLHLSDIEAQGEDVAQSIHVQAVGLRLLAGLAGIVALLVVAQLLTRLIVLEAADNPSLEAVGMSRRQRALVAVARASAIGGGAALTCVVAAVLLSPLFPTGLAGTAEPHPGFAVDWTALAVGAALTLALPPLVSLLPAWLATRPAATSDVGARRSRAVTWATRLGLPLPSVAGVRMALSRGTGRDAVPVVSSLTTITLGVTVLVGALTFGTSLRHLLDTPRLYGLGWDVQMTTYGEPVADFLAPIAQEHPDVDGLAIGATNLVARVGEDQVDLLGLDAVAGHVLPPLLTGRLPEGPDEVALAPETFDDLDIAIGETIDVRAIEGQEASMTVVGTTVLPDTTEAARRGRGALVSVAGFARLAGFPTTDLAAQDLFLDLAQGSDPGAVASDLAESACEEVPDPEGCFLYPIVYPPPTDVVNFGRAENLPLAMGGVIGVLAVGTLVHVVVTAARRRRRDLALLRTLGFTGRQLVSTISTHATTAVAIGLVVGIPVGLAAGRWLWTLRVEQLGLIVDTRVPAAAAVALAIGALVLANLVALVPGRAAARAHAAEVLRAE